MKKVLAVVLAVALVSFGAFSANAVPHLVVFFDANHTETTAVCPGVGVFQNLYVVAVDWGMWMSAIEYSVSYPAALTHLADISPAPLNIGTTPSGVASSWNIPQNAFDPLRIMTVLVQWNCADCSGYENSAVRVDVHPLTGHLRAARWPDSVLFNGVGVTSLICPTVPVQETTWGQMKALYNN